LKGQKISHKPQKTHISASTSIHTVNGIKAPHRKSTVKLERKEATLVILSFSLLGTIRPLAVSELEAEDSAFVDGSVLLFLYVSILAVYVLASSFLLLLLEILGRRGRSIRIRSIRLDK